MKLIIDIPKSEYMKIKKYYDSLPEYSTVEAEMYYIAHGTPLDSVKAKVDQLPLVLLAGNYHIDKDYVMDILDNIGEAESEE